MATKAKVNRVESLLKLTRFWNLLIIGLAQYFTAGMLIDRHHIFDFRLFLLSSSTALIAAAGYIINDYYDVKIDLVNKPDRVVIGKSITRRYALLFHSLLSIAGIAIGFLLNWKIGVMNIGSAFLLWFYSNELKRQPFIGNFVVALLTGVAIIIVDVFYRSGNALIIIYASFAFFMTLVREIIKDMEDLKGDNTFGCKTLPIIWGMRKTKMAIYFILILFSITIFLLNEFYSQLPLEYFLIFLFIPLVWLLARLIRADTKKDFAWLSMFCKVIMLFGVLSMAFI
ncbi:MAG: geranylgeranylglycerol-phosphate geranylgeranyltransferase [Cyclobacteriaceae bacterium]|nr:geranylgeranylglycerol-phosphate geranylgeranyltransferase [Cyclobacteriaceae bacterium]